MRILIIFLFFCFQGFQISAQEISLQKGVVMDSIQVNDSLSQSFSIYLPSSFQPNEKFPVLFVFDPEGRARAAAQLFKPAAEQQGFIIVSSNTPFTGKPLSENISTAGGLVKDVLSRLPVDLSQVVVAGLSEGAQVASALPAVFEDLLGVLAIGGQQVNFATMEESDAFTFVGIAGDEDYSSYGLPVAVQNFRELGFPTALYIFDGADEWPNPELINSALGSITLQAMKDGKRPVDEELVESLYRNDLDFVNRLLSRERYLDASWLLGLFQNKYEDLVDISLLEDKLNQLQGSRNFEQAAELQMELRRKESRLVEDFIYYFNEDVATANFQNLGWWNYQKLQLDKMAVSVNESEADMGARLISLLRELAAAKHVELEDADDASLESKLLAAMIHTVFDQNNFDAYKEVISLSAKDGDFDTALFYLEEMLKNGYDDLEELYEIEGTLGLKLTPEFNWLIKKYLGTARYYEDFN